MKSLVSFIALVFAVVVFLCPVGDQPLAGEEVYKMTGEIAAIDLAHNTVVVEVALGQKMFTVGGPLSSGAVLKKAGQVVGLADFRRGDRVTVTWEATESGHLIVSLKAK
jgi:hypothetical protein